MEGKGIGWIVLSGFLFLEVGVYLLCASPTWGTRESWTTGQFFGCVEGWIFIIVALFHIPLFAYVVEKDYRMKATSSARRLYGMQKL